MPKSCAQPRTADPDCDCAAGIGRFGPLIAIVWLAWPVRVGVDFARLRFPRSAGCAFEEDERKQQPQPHNRKHDPNLGETKPHNLKRPSALDVASGLPDLRRTRLSKLGFESRRPEDRCKKGAVRLPYIQLAGAEGFPRPLRERSTPPSQARSGEFQKRAAGTFS